MRPCIGQRVQTAVTAWLTLEAIDARMKALGADLPDRQLVDDIQTELAQQVLMRRQNMRFQRTVLRTHLISETTDDDQVRDQLLDLATQRDWLLEYRSRANLVALQIFLAVIGKPISAVLTARRWFRRQETDQRPGPVSGKRARAAGGVIRSGLIRIF